jgi:hypothetical protein
VIKPFLYNLSILLIILILVSCEKEISLKLNAPQDMLSLNSILEAGNDSIIINITKIQEIENANDFIPVDNATIEIKKNNEILSGIFYKGNGKYLLTHQPKSGEKYEIKVWVDGYKTLLAETRIPPFPIVNTEWKKDTIFDPNWINGYRTRNKLLVTIEDNPTKDYYWFRSAKIYSYKGKPPLVSFSSSYKSDKMYFDDFNRYYVQDNSYPFANYLYVGALRLDDEVFTNNQVQFSLSFAPKNTFFAINGDIHFDKYYKSSIKQFLTYEYDDLPIFEPVQMYSNIENGFGIFSSIAVKQFFIDEPQ